MVNSSRVLLNLEILVNQWRCEEAVNVIIGIEDEPGTGKIAPVKLQRLRVQIVLLG